MYVEELRIPTEQGVELIYTDLTVAIVDIDPAIDGVFGMNFLSSGWTGSLLGDLGDLADLLDDAGLGDLLGGLGGLGLGASPFGIFEQVHFDFRQIDRGIATVVLDLAPEVGAIEAPASSHGDLDDDWDVDLDDRRIWVRDIKRTYFGDANLDGRFDTADLVGVFQIGEYEDGLVKNSTWASGDWSGDGEFDSQDLVLAFQDGGFERTTAVAVVPEPASAHLLAMGLLLMMRRRVGGGDKPAR
jgi:hypothetical protein